MFPILFQAIICISRRLDRSLVTVLGLAAQIFQGSVLCACSITCLVSMSMLLWCISVLRQTAHSQELPMYLAMLEITGFGKRSNWAMTNNHTKLLLKVSEMENNCNVDVKKFFILSEMGEMENWAAERLFTTVLCSHLNQITVLLQWLLSPNRIICLIVSLTVYFTCQVCSYICYLWFVLGIRGKGYKGDIAIDDLSIALKPSCNLYSGSLPAAGSTVAPVTTAAPNNCLVSQFACVSDGKCIQLGQVCDFNLDCVDGSDERSCRKWYNILCSGGMNPLAIAFLVVTHL